MSDYNASLPIHSITESNPVKVSKDLSANANNNVIWVNLSDGGNELTIDANGAILVDKTKIWDGTNTLSILLANSAYGATPGGLAVFGKYESSPTVYGDGDATPLLTDANGRLITVTTIPFSYVDDSAFTTDTDKIGVTGMYYDDTAPDQLNAEGNVGVPRIDVYRRQLNRIVGSTDTYRWEISSGNRGYVRVSKDDNDNAQGNPIYTVVSKDTNANSATNPIYVHVVGKAITGEVCDYSTQAAVGGGLSNNHVYPVSVGKTLLLERIDCSASGAGRWEVQVGPVALLVTKAVKFTSSAEQNAVFEFTPPIEITEAGGTEQVRIIRKNREGAAQDVYSTIMGEEQ